MSIEAGGFYSNYYAERMGRSNRKGVYLTTAAGVTLAFWAYVGVGIVTEAFYDEVDAVTTVKENGWDNAEVIDVHRLFPLFDGCKLGDVLGYEVEAVSPDGSPANLNVCVGVDGATVTKR